MPDALWIVIGTVAGALITKVADWASSRSRNEAEATSTLSEAESIATTTFITKLDHAWHRADELEFKVEYLTTVVDALLTQLRENDIHPVYPPMPPRPFN